MRNNFRAGLLATVFCSGLVMAMPASAETLGEAIASAIDTNPSVQNQRSVLRNADETYLRSRVTNLQPTLTLSGSVTGSANDSSFINDGKLDVGPFPTGANVSLSAGTSQNLYRGGQTANAMESARISLLQARETYENSEQTLIQSVVTAYTDVRKAVAQLDIAQQGLANAQKSLEEAQVKYDVGSATVTDRARAEAQVASSQSSLI